MPISSYVVKILLRCAESRRMAKQVYKMKACWDPVSYQKFTNIF